MPTSAETIILENQLVIMAALTTIISGDNATDKAGAQNILAEAFNTTQQFLEFVDSTLESMPQ